MRITQFPSSGKTMDFRICKRHVRFCTLALATLGVLTLIRLYGGEASRVGNNDGEVMLAKEKLAIPVALNDATAAAAEFCTGTSQKVAVSFKFAKGKSLKLDGVVRADVLLRQVEKDGKKVPESVPMEDALIEFKGVGLSFHCHIRPYLKRYTEAQQNALAAVWTTFPAASQHFFALEVRSDNLGTELWLEGRFCGRLQSDSRLVEVIFELEAGGALRKVSAFNIPEIATFLPLDIRNVARPNVIKDALISLKPGRQKIKDVPMIVAQGSENADVGAVKEMQGLSALETDENTSRTSLDGMPEALHFSVPQEYYHRAWVLCAVEPDEKKDPVLTTRLTRFGISGRGGAIADTTLLLPRGDEKPGSGIERVGSVEYGAADGKKITAPLLLVKVDLKAGEILDLLADREDPFAAMKVGPYLDFEFLGKLDRIYVQTDRSHKPLRSSTSAVHIFGVTLEKAPVELRLKQSQPGNIFHNDEKPETIFALRANVAGKYTLKWVIADVAGRTLLSQEKTVELIAAGSVMDIVIPLAMPDLGWYGLRVALTGGDGQPFLKHDAAFALLGKDTRVAGYESPFGTWWFGGAHYSTRDLAISGSLLFKAGMRRTPVAWTKDSEADLAPWKFTLNQINWPFRLKDLDNWDAATARVEKQTHELIKRFPHCQYVDIFHESFDSGTVPPELYGEKPPASADDQAKREEQLYALGVKAAKFFREKFPQLKLILGNSGGSSTLVAMLLRRGFPREYIDFLGSETTGQTFSPEKMSIHTTMGIWMLRETARKFGHEIPLTGCFEFTYRAERDLGAQRLAEWYSRDVLIALAFQFPTISPAVIEDVGNAYFETLWGAAGLCQRNALHYPKPAYVAMATLTKVLDSARLMRQLPTGSSSAYALEFERGNERIYALWTPRGTCEMTLEFPAETIVTQTEFYGRQIVLNSAGKKLKVTASTAVTYMTSPIAAGAVTAGQRAFPLNQPPAQTVVVNRMDDLSQWKLAPEDHALTQPMQRPGQFALRQVNDSDKGACLELELDHKGEVMDLVGEYVALRLKRPAPIPGQPHTVGVWVKGDSSWGRIFWELEDSKGERWCSSASIRDGVDWANHSAIDFDGWCFVTFPLTDASPAWHLEPTPGCGLWVHSAGDGKLDYPLKLVSLYVMTHRKSVNLTEMQPVKNPIRLKDVSVFGEPK